MKKLTTLFICLFICISGLFANPTLYDSIIKDEEVLEYVSDDCQTCYSLFYIYEPDIKDYAISFYIYSFISDVSIHIKYDFENEKAMLNFAKKINLPNLEVEIKKLRQQLTDSNIKYKIMYSDKDETIINSILYYMKIDK